MTEPLTREQVERFGLLVVNTNTEVQSSLAIHPEGDWVKFADYDALRAQLAQATETVASHEYYRNNWQKECTSLREELVRVTAERDEQVWRAHVPVTGTQHDPSRGLLHGYCERCRAPWPCEWAPESRTLSLQQQFAEAQARIKELEAKKHAQQCQDDMEGT